MTSLAIENFRKGHPDPPKAKKDLKTKMLRSAQHDKKDFALQDSTVYGPIHSRRLGHSLGINPLPVSYKFCDFDCVYCQYSWTPEKGTGEKIKRAPQLLQKIQSAFEYHTKIKTHVDCITLAGNGEPTIHPDFLKLVTGLVQLRDQFYPKAKLGVLTDSSQVHRLEIRDALEMLDERYMKLDAGSPELLAKINKPRGDFDFERMVNALRSMRDIVIQSLFMQGSFDNTQPEDIDHWIETVGFIQAREVQVYTIDRKPADPGLKKVSAKRLHEIAEACQSMTGIRSVVYD